jgi:hypothetical protein
VHTAAVHVPVHVALSSHLKPQFDAALQVMSHFDVSLQAMSQCAPVEHSIAQSLLPVHVRLHGDFVQVKRHVEVPLQTQFAPHSPVVGVAASTPASFGVPASKGTAASTIGTFTPPSGATPSPTCQS